MNIKRILFCCYFVVLIVMIFCSAVLVGYILKQQYDNGEFSLKQYMSFEKKGDESLKETDCHSIQAISDDHSQEIYDSVLRFHIRANSDSTEDQNVKMKVKQTIVDAIEQWSEDEQNRMQCEQSSLQTKIANHKNGNYTLSKEMLKSIILQHKKELETMAVQILRQEDFSYGVKVYFTKEAFPVKQYGDLTFPAGTYEALRIDLGQAKGHNWWCMIYPNLCFYDATTGVVPDDSKEQLQQLLPETEYEDLLNPDNEIELRSGIVEWIKKVSLFH